jgi:hypothetical protein
MGLQGKHGGYYNPKAKTYADEEGGFLIIGEAIPLKMVHKSVLRLLGCKTKTFKLADGRVAKSSVTSEEALRRCGKRHNDGYDKYLIVRSMIQRINLTIRAHLRTLKTTLVWKEYV